MAEAGIYYGEVPPVPIPNTEVKLTCAEDTWREAARKNRSSPALRESRKCGSLLSLFCSSATAKNGFPDFVKRKSGSHFLGCGEQIKLVSITVRSHPFPSRTRKLSSPVPKILGGKLPGKIGLCQHNKRCTGSCSYIAYFLLR